MGMNWKYLNEIFNINGKNKMPKTLKYFIINGISQIKK